MVIRMVNLPSRLSFVILSFLVILTTLLFHLYMSFIYETPSARCHLLPLFNPTTTSSRYPTSSDVDQIHGDTLRNEQKQEHNVETMSSGGEDAVIVYTNLGDSFKYQFYVWHSIHQSRLMNPSVRIVLISSSSALSDPLVSENSRKWNVETVSYDKYLTSDALIREFDEVFFVEGDMVPMDGNRDFVRLTTKRLFVLHAWMNATSQRYIDGSVGNVIHLENDNMLYVNTSFILSHFHACSLRLAFPIASDFFAILGIMYIHAPDDLAHLLRFNINIFKLGRAGAIRYLGHGMINDMTISSKYLWELRHRDTHQGVSELPDRVYVEEGENCVWDRTGIVFDAATIGHWFGGTHTCPDCQFFSDEDRRILDPRVFELTWRQVGDVGYVVPFMGEMRVGNLHIHSKQLHLWLSTVHQPISSASSSNKQSS